jgi:hypothetical protein
MVVSLSTILEQIARYSSTYEKMMEARNRACVTPIDVNMLIDCVSTVPEEKQRMYNKAMEAFDTYKDIYGELRSNTRENMEENDAILVEKMGAVLHHEDIEYFVYKMDRDASVKITEEKVGQFIKDIEDIGYEVYRFYEAKTSVIPEEALLMMYQDFYNTFEAKE